ncbi:hypothetical protein D3C75_1083090 [compost metagenome]
MNTLSLSNRPYWLKAPDKGWRGWLAGMLSGSPTATANEQRALNSDKAKKIDCQPYRLTNTPPSIGARMGARPITSINCEKTLADATASHLSLTIARDNTMPAQPPNACTKRATIRASRLGAKAQANDARVNSVTPTSKGTRRPKRSATGP